MSDTQASDSQPSLVRRLLRTPLRGLWRGRVGPTTGPRTVQSVLAAPNLPAPAADLIARVARRTRLWRSEQIDVATELVAHFADGLDAGTPLDDLLARFGDERRAARLIRRAKRRNRPLLWQAWRVLCYGFLAICLSYALLATYYFAGRPTPSVDYVAELNKPVLSTPETQRAWPLYRQAILDLHLTSSNAKDQKRQDLRRTLDARPGSKRWPATLAWLGEHRADLDVIHRAADRPHLGFVLGPGGSADDPALFPTFPHSAGPSMFDVIMPALNPLREIAVALTADAAAATEAGDRARFLRDARSLLALADQVREHPSLVAQLVSVSIRSLAYDAIDRALASPHVTMLTDGDLRDLAHRLAAGPQTSADLFDFRYERMFFHDSIQRMYTAGGPGGGHLTPEGIRFIDHVIGASIGTGATPAATAFRTAVQPASLLLVAPRDEILNRYDGLLDRAEALLHEPVRDADWTSWNTDAAFARETLLTSVRNFPIAILLPSLNRIPVTAERCLAFRDGVLCGIALETYHRHHDSTYPPDLNALVPGLLPAVPVDRVTGDPLHYTLKAGRPVVYSVGVDRTDNGGTPPVKGETNRGGWDAGLGSPANLHGDWVLYPKPEEPPKDDD